MPLNREQTYHKFAKLVLKVCNEMDLADETGDECSRSDILDMFYTGMVKIFTQDNPAFDVVAFHQMSFPPDQN